MKVDLQKCFWSILLPPHVQGAFSFASRSHVFACRCLPFGWSWSPILAQLHVRHVLLPLQLFIGRLFWQYVDDVLIAHEDPHFLVFVFHFTCHLLVTANFNISSKSSTSPTTSITWLGKILCSTPFSITNSVDQVAKAILYIFFFHQVGATETVGAPAWHHAMARHAC